VKKEGGVKTQAKKDGQGGGLTRVKTGPEVQNKQFKEELIGEYKDILSTLKSTVGVRLVSLRNQGRR